MPGLAARRNARSLAPIQTSFTEKPHTKAVLSSGVVSAPPEARMSEPKPTAEEETLKALPTLKRKKSRPTFLDLFGKSNVERSHGNSETIPPIPKIPKEHETLSRRHSTINKKPPRSAEGEAPSTLSSKPSRPQLRATKSAKSLHSQAKKDGQQMKPFKVPWHPPPLFQAYPQAIIHTSLEVPASLKDSAPGGEKDTSLPGTSDGQNVTSETTPKAPRFLGRIKSRSRLREDAKGSEQSKSKATSCARHVYILVTSGYLLQYTGDGPFDRLPEKILKLGPESAAFASDAIEGKHWVLEVLQAAKSDDFCVETGRKTFLSKLGVQTAYTRRLTSSLFLVFNGAEEMDSWLVAIRREIGADVTKLQRRAPEAPSLIRYSSIVRHKQPNKDVGHLSPQPQSSASSPTVVESQRASSTVVASASTANFPTRYSRQLSPCQNAGDFRPLSIVSSRSDRDVIGPALKSPGFFERQRTPMTAEFPDTMWPGQRWNDPLPLESPTRLNSPSYAHYSALNRSRSVQSLSSKSSNIGGESDRPITARPTLQHRYSETEISGSADDAGLRVALPVLPLPSPALQNFPEPPRRTATSTKEMESISESPPQSKQGDSVREVSIAGIDAVAEAKRIPYTRASASFIPGAATLTDDTRTGKRKSVFARPIPIATPQPPASPRSAERSDPVSRRTSMRDTPPLSNRTSTYFDPPKSPTSSHPSRRPSQDNSMRLLHVSIDHTPFLAATQSPNDSPSANAATTTLSTEQRTSKKVPIVRPPMIRNGPRARSSAPHLHFPPPRPPPTVPLPAPPTING